MEDHKIDKYDIVDWLEDAFDESFNLRLEDGSVEEMSQILFECISLVRKQTPAEIVNVLARLPNSNQTNAIAQQNAIQEESDDDSETEEMIT